MKKQLLLIAAFCGLVAGTSTKTEAQAITTLGPRLIVNQPASVAGTKNFTYSSDPNYAGPWGRTLDSTWYMVPLVKLFDSPDTIQCTAALPNAYTDKWVLVFRGSCNFSAKALYVQNAGAKGIIIVNNVPGADPVGMGAGGQGALIHIPVLMVSNYDGLAINTSLNNGDSVKISLTEWGFGFNNDLTLVPHSMPFPHAGAIPFTQLDAAAPPQAYNMYTGGLVANVGLSDATSVELNSNITWTPTGGSPSVVYQDSVNLGTIATTDSILQNFSTNPVFQPTATQTGMYNIKYNINSDNADENPTDDSASYPMYVTDSIFCKSRWDNAKGQPVTNGSVTFASGDAMTWGPLFYIKNGGYTTSKFQFNVSDGDTSKHDLSQQTQVFVYMYKWVDGSNANPTDNLIQSGELTLQAIGGRPFTSLDSDGQALTVEMNDIAADPGTTAKLDNNAWYWFALDMGTLSLGVDINANYYGRETAAKANGVIEYGAPNFDGNNATMFSSGGTMAMIPFVASTDIDSVGFRTFDNLTPSTALYISTQVGAAVKNVSQVSQFTVYPNPATDLIHVKLALSHPSDVLINIANATGVSMLREKHSKVQNDDFSFSTSKLAPGQYYMVVSSSEGNSVKPFTVLAK